MVAQSEYAVYSKQLETVGQSNEALLSSELEQADDLGTAKKVTISAAARYHLEFEDLLASALADTGNTVVDHYVRAMDVTVSNAEKNKIVSEQIMKQTHEKFYYMTLGERLAASRLANAQRIERSAVTGKELDTRKRNLSRIFMHSYPYGSQVLHDRRILLSQLVKLEHDIALAVAAHADVSLVKWALSHKHKVKDICDTYAEYVDPNVKRYLAQHKINLSPAGLYFLADVPEPPHPNCQCALLMVHKGRLTSSLIERTIDKLKELLGKFRRKRAR